MRILTNVRTLSLIPIFCICFSVTYGQAIDSLSAEITTISAELNSDSLQQRLAQLPDTLLRPLQRLDSIRNQFALEADRMQKKYLHGIAEAEGETKTVKIIIDSVHRLDLPTQKYTRKLDSLHQLRNTFESKYKSRFDSLKARTIGRLQGLDLPSEYKEPLQKLTTNITDLDINTGIARLPSLEIPGYSLPNMNGLDGLISKVGEVGNIDNRLKIPEVETLVGDIEKEGVQVFAYQEDIKNITHGKIQDVEKLPEIIEGQASKIDGMDELQKQTGVLEGHKGQFDELSDPKSAKEKAISLVKKAMDHFAGKQQQLKGAMEKISKYKQRYSSISSIKDLPKRPPNPMKGKPFIERLVPGLYFQYQQKTYYLLDANPYLGYKISGRFIAGAGWNHRLAYDHKYERWNQRSRIFGPRAYIDFKLGKGFIAHLEGESMNSFVLSTLHGSQDAGEREWVWSFMTGLKKEYKIYEGLKGTALIQYNLFNRYYKAPYVDRLNSRIGFEYNLKKKKSSRNGNG